MKEIQYLLWDFELKLDKIEERFGKFDEILFYSMVIIVGFFLVGAIWSALLPKARRLLTSRWRAVLRILGALALLAALLLLSSCDRASRGDGQKQPTDLTLTMDDIHLGWDEDDPHMKRERVEDGTSVTTEPNLLIHRETTRRSHRCMVQRPTYPVDESTKSSHTVNCYIWSLQGLAPE